MPVVIKELHVRAIVEEEKKDRPPRSETPSDRINLDTLIDACVEKVVEIMKKENLR